MLILGVNASSHNTSAALLADGRLAAFAEEERFNRERYTMGFPEGAVRFALGHAGVRAEDVDAVVFAGSPTAEILHSAWDALRLAGRPWYRTWLRDQALVTGAYKGWNQKRRLRSRFGWTGESRCLPHHDCHASSAYHCSPFDDAAVLTIDAQGDGIATAIYEGRGGRLRRLRSWGFPEHSLGHFYDVVGEWLGFKPVKDAGKTMGLAPYGDAKRRRADFDRFTRIDADGTFTADLDFLKESRERRASPRFEALFGPARDLSRDSDPTDPRWADVAAGAQCVIEDAVFALAREARRITGLPNLCIAGGVGLNSVANGKLDLAGIFEEVWIQPAAYDAGLSLGAALLAWHGAGGARRFTMEHAYWGPDTKPEDVRAALEVAKAEYRETPDAAATAAELVAKGRIVGWYQGRAEVGPRSLGNRSILADPQRADAKDVVNREVKHREPFRPFAPSCTLEDSHRWFESGRATPFMLKVWQVRAEARAKLPAITHVDGSARLQTVTPSENALYHRLLVEVGRRTGIPCVLNTSFNIRGEPIVNSPMDALKCFFTTGLDALVIGPYVLEKRRVRGA
ncbi:MAG: nebramycin 5' synthase [Planctomycetes bacterium]|nr:nebramycin 5' synthase [Planctomycetota bacterium]